MNFISTFEELDKLYEGETKKKAVCAKGCTKDTGSDIEEGVLGTALAVGAGAMAGTALGNALSEDTEEDFAEEEAPRRVIIECDKCGALVIKAEAAIVADEESDLVNMEDACQYCEATEGYKILGTLVPYEADEVDSEEAEVVEEGLFDFGKRKKEVAARNAAKSAKFSANRKEAEQKALKDTTVVVQMYRDQSHDPSVEDYYDLAMNAEAVAKRLTNTETDKNIVYRTMSAEQAKKLGAMVHVPERFIAKFLKESTEPDCNKDIEEGLLDVNLPVDVDVTANGNDVAVGGLA